MEFNCNGVKTPPPDRPNALKKKVPVVFIKILSLTNFSGRRKGRKSPERCSGTCRREAERGEARPADTGLQEGGVGGDARSRDRRDADVGMQMWAAFVPGVSPPLPSDPEPSANS